MLLLGHENAAELYQHQSACGLFERGSLFFFSLSPAAAAHLLIRDLGALVEVTSWAFPYREKKNSHSARLALFSLPLALSLGIRRVLA